MSRGASAQLLALQRAAGNTAVTSLLQPNEVVAEPGCGPDRSHGDGTAPVARQQEADSEPSDNGGGADTGGDSATTGATSGPCAPEAKSRTDYLQVAGTTRDDFGLTVLDASQVTMAWSIAPIGRGRRVRVQLDTAPQLPTIPSVYTGAGRFPDSQGPATTIVVSATHGPCAGARDVPRTWVVTTDGAARIRAAEQEHCDDFQYAFDQTLAMYARAVQRAARRRSWPSERSLLRALKRYAQGEDPDSWPSQWERMVNRTRRRDTRLHHKPNISSRDAWTPSRGSRCYVVIRIGSRALPEVGQHPSAELMR